MKTIKIGDKVWDIIVENGKFGETADDVLVRLITGNGGGRCIDEAVEQPKPGVGKARAWKERRATVRMTQATENGALVLRFETGQNEKWKLPTKDDHKAIREIRDNAITFVRKNGGTEGQERAAIRALTSRGYHVAPKSSFD